MTLALQTCMVYVNCRKLAIQNQRALCTFVPIGLTVKHAMCTHNNGCPLHKCQVSILACDFNQVRSLCIHVTSYCRNINSLNICVSDSKVHIPSTTQHCRLIMCCGGAAAMLYLSSVLAPDVLQWASSYKPSSELDFHCTCLA